MYKLETYAWELRTKRLNALNDCSANWNELANSNSNFLRSNKREIENIKSIERVNRGLAYLLNCTSARGLILEYKLAIAHECSIVRIFRLKFSHLCIIDIWGYSRSRNHVCIKSAEQMQRRVNIRLEIGAPAGVLK